MFTNGRQMKESTAMRRYGHFITVMNVAASNGTSRLDKCSKKKKNFTKYFLFDCVVYLSITVFDELNSNKIHL